MRSLVIAAILIVPLTAMPVSAENTEVCVPGVFFHRCAANVATDFAHGVVAVSPTGDASGTFVGVSGTGDANSREGRDWGCHGYGMCEYHNRNLIGVSGTGDAGAQWVAVSGTGDAGGEWVSVSGTGDAGGCAGYTDCGESWVEVHGGEVGKGSVVHVSDDNQRHPLCQLWGLCL